MREGRQKAGWSGAALYGGAFMVPVCVMLAILRQGGFVPFGSQTMFLMDMRDQYLEFYAYLRYLAGGDNSVFFCWSRSMGGNFLGLFAYYLASPLSFLVCFFPLEKMDLAIVFLTVLKIGLCGASFAGYAAYLWKHRMGDKKIFPPAVWMFSACYALISYNMVYSLCLMWLDGVILLPMVLMGAEKILDGKKGLQYTLSLLAVFLCNYYIGYMVGIFTAIFFVYRAVCRLAADVRAYLAKGVRFGVCTCLAAGMSMPLLLPAFKILMEGRLAGQNEYRFSLEPNFLFADFLGKFRGGIYDGIVSGLPSVYCGFIVLILMAGFFSCHGISLREKAGAILVTVWMALSFYYKGLNIAWHGFRPPIWFPYRYAFIFSFFMIYLAFLTFCTMWAESRRERVKQILLTAVFVLTLFDLKFNAQTMLAGLDEDFEYLDRNDYVTFLDRNKSLVEQIRERDAGLYRVNANYEFSKNDAMLLGFNGMTHYSSTYNEAVNQLTKKLGLGQAHFWNSGYGTNPMLDSLFSVSYKLSDRQEPAVYERLFDEGKGTAVYGNPLALPMVYAADVSTIDPVLAEREYLFQNQNLFLNAIAGGQEAYFREVAYSYEDLENGWGYTLTADSGNPLYLYMEPENVGWANVYVNDVLFGEYFSTQTTCSFYLGSYAAGEQVKIRVEPTQADPRARSAVIAELDMEALLATLNRLRQGGMKITKHGGGKLNGTISLKEGQTVMTSIPYDKGWTVRVDGQKVQPLKFAGTFLAFDAPPGEHEIRLSYVSPGFGTGIIIFLLALSAAAIYSRK